MKTSQTRNVTSRGLHLHSSWTWASWCGEHRQIWRDHHRAFKFIVTDFGFFDGLREAEAPPLASA